MTGEFESAFREMLNPVAVEAASEAIVNSGLTMRNIRGMDIVIVCSCDLMKPPSSLRFPLEL